MNQPRVSCVNFVEDLVRFSDRNTRSRRFKANQSNTEAPDIQMEDLEEEESVNARQGFCVVRVSSTVLRFQHQTGSLLVLIS